MKELVTGMPHQTRSRLLVSKIFLFASLCCCVAHVVYITMTYFSYSTTTRITMDKRQRVDAPTLVACVRYEQVLDYEAVNEKLGLEESPDKIPGTNYSDLLTVRDIFQFTPQKKQILKRCIYRRPQDRRVLLHDSRDCGFFRITKFVMQSFVCYSVAPVNRSEFMIEELASSYNFEHTVYVVEWDQVFNNARNIFVILTDNVYPYRSRLFGTMKLIDTPLETTTGTLEIFVRNKITKVRLQPSPYDTMCDPMYTMDDKTKCLIKKMEDRGLNRVPNTEILTKPLDAKQVQPRDERNDTMRRLLDQIYADCDQEERTSEKCNYTISETDARFYESNSSRYVRFRVMSPFAANSLIVAFPSFVSYEYLLYVCSCVGIWFGLSVQDLSPDRLIPRVTRLRTRLQLLHQQHMRQKVTGLGPWKRVTVRTEILTAVPVCVNRVTPQSSAFRHKQLVRVMDGQVL